LNSDIMLLLVWAMAMDPCWISCMLLRKLITDAYVRR
jgi:hypothetical protein